MPEDITARREGAALVLELQRSGGLNALTSAMLDRLEALLEQADHSDARAIVITSAHAKAFSVGTDLREIAPLDPAQLDRRNDRARQVFARLHAHRLLSFAHVCGHALGGGLELALSCTFRLLGPDARLGLPEIRLGVIPTYGGIAPLLGFVRPDLALDLLCSGRSLDAQEAMAAGLGTRLLRTGALAEALEVVAQFTSQSLAAQRCVRQAVHQIRAAADATQAAHAEAQAAAQACRLLDFREGLSAFLEKRPPRFRDE